MAFSKGQKVIDLLLAIPASDDNAEWYASFKPLLRDPESREVFKMPAQYMFKDIPQVGPVEDKVAWTVKQMDRFNIERAMVGMAAVSGEIAVSDAIRAAKGALSDRFLFDLGINPNEGMDAVRAIRRAKRELGIHAVSCFPAGVNPQAPINDKCLYPVYAACVEEGLPIFVNVGVPGPRVPGACQDVRLVDEVCWFFPELKFVMRHGAEPDEAMAVKLMLKYPNLFYSTSAFAPKHYPKAILEFMNKRGSDKVLYAGYFPMGLSLDRIFSEFEQLPLSDEVWPKFLYQNAAKLFGLGE